jgi:Chaperone of endosialidase
MAVPYTFGSATTSIPLSQLDSNFATAITLGNTAVQLGNTITSLTGVSNVASATSLSLGSNGNTTAVTINTSQQVGIGTASPNEKLVVNGAIRSTNNAVGATATADSGVFYFVPTADAPSDPRTMLQGVGTAGVGASIAFLTGTSASNSERMRIDSSGNVGIGTSSPSTYGNLVVANPSGATTLALRSSGGSVQQTAIKFSQGSSSGDTRIVSEASNDNLQFWTAATERMRINSSGVAMFGTTNATPAGSSDTKGISLWTDGSTSQIFASSNSDTAAVFNRATTDGALVRFRRQGSDVGSVSVNGTNTTYNTSSDYRLKENITPMTGALAKVALLKPVTYKWKVDGSNGEGFIAHELQAVKPDCVSGDKDATREEQYEVTPAVKDGEGNITTPAVMGTRTVPDYQGVDTSFLVATLTAAIQELKAINDTQAETINALTARIVALEAK